MVISYITEYVVWEQVCFCGLDCNRIDIAEECLYQLSNKFPNSCRVRLLEELTLEFLERCLRNSHYLIC